VIKKGLKKEEADALKAKLEAGIASHNVTLFSVFAAYVVLALSSHFVSVAVGGKISLK
jgi:hypothetical protein